MLAQYHWSDIEWKRDDERRLKVMLGFSILLHLVLLLAWKLPPQAWQAADHAVLTVVLRAAAPPSRGGFAAARQADRAVLLQQDTATAAVAVPPKPAAPGIVASSPVAPQPVPPLTPARVAAQAAPGRPIDAAPAAVGVTAMLVVGAQGRVEQIYWTQLPALTDEQFRRLEAGIREKTYAAGRIVHEVVDVRGVLKLPPAPTTDRPVAPSAPQGE